MQNNDLLLQYNSEFLNDEPVELFDGIIIYPVIMHDYIKFSLSSSVLKINKNDTNDPKIISMSYLDYLIYLIREENKESNEESVRLISNLLVMLISLVLREDNPEIGYGTDEKGKNYIKINGVLLYKKEFEKMRYFILYQNIPDYSEKYINPELEKDLRKAEEIRNRGKKPCDIEKQEMAVVIGSSLTLEDVKKMTIRKFYIALEMIDKKLSYTMLKTAELSGFVTFKEEIVHYLVEKEDNEYNVIDYDQFKNQINNS